MANKVQEYLQLSEQATRQISGSYKEWTGFLTTAARLDLLRKKVSVIK